MTDQEKDKELVEWLGGCWHEWEVIDPIRFVHRVKCTKCNLVAFFSVVEEFYSVPNLSTWKGFGWCWEKMKEFHYIDPFIHWLLGQPIFWYEWENKIPRERCNLIWEFKESRKEK